MSVASTECVLIASVLTNEARPGPCLCTAVAYWPYWESPEASKLAEGICKVVRRGFVVNKSMVKAVLEPDLRAWLDHPTFDDGLPMGLAEVEAKSLLPIYQGKRLIEVVGRCYQKMIDKPHTARMLALHLKLELGDLI